MEASTPYHTFGSRRRKITRKEPRTWRAFTLRRTAAIRDPPRERNVFRISSNRSHSRRRTLTQALDIANAGAALKMNRAADWAMKMAVIAHTTTNRKSGVGRFGMLRAIQTRPKSARKYVAAPKERMSWLSPGACASAIVEYAFERTKYPAPETKAVAIAG